MPTSRELWLQNVRSGSGGINGGKRLGSQVRDPNEAWFNGLRKSGSATGLVSGIDHFGEVGRPTERDMATLSTSNYLKEKAGTGAKAAPKRAISSAPARPPKATPGRPNYKSVEEYYDEIIELRRQLTQTQAENQVLKGRVRRLEEESAATGRELLRVTEPERDMDQRRALAGKKPDTSAVVANLKAKLYKVESQLREKEAAYSQLEGDLKSTSARETEQQLEMCFGEIHRLQQLLEMGNVGPLGPCPEHGNIDGSELSSPADTPRQGKTREVKGTKALREKILKLTSENERLARALEETEMENKTVKEKLETPAVPTREQSREQKQRRLLLDDLAALKERLAMGEENTNEAMKNLDSSRSKVDGKIDLKGSLSERLQQLDARESELLDKISSLYKQKEDLSDKLASTKDSQKELREDARRTEADLGRSEAERARSERKEKELRRGSEASPRREGARDNRRQSTPSPRRGSGDTGDTRKRRSSSSEREVDESVSLLQSSLKGHKRREKRLAMRKTEEEEDDDSMDESVTALQSAFKSHKSRRDLMSKYNTNSDDDF